MCRKAQYHSRVAAAEGYGEHHRQDRRAWRTRSATGLSYPWGRLRQASRVHHHPVRPDPGREPASPLRVPPDADQWSQHARRVVPQRQGALGWIPRQDHQRLWLCHPRNCWLLHPWIWSLHLQGMYLVNNILYLYSPSSASHRINLSSKLVENISAVLRRAILSGCFETDRCLSMKILLLIHYLSTVAKCIKHYKYLHYQ